MACVILLLVYCLFYMSPDVFSHKKDWYRNGCFLLVSQVSDLSEWGRLCWCLFIPLVLTVIYVLFSFLAGSMGVFLLSFLLIWFFVDYRVPDSIDKMDLGAVIENFVERVLALVFWFVVAGPLGLILFVWFLLLRGVNQEEGGVQFGILSAVINWVVRIMCWLPYQLTLFGLMLVFGAFGLWRIWLDLFFKVWSDPVKAVMQLFDQSELKGTGSSDLSLDFIGNIVFFRVLLVGWLCLLVYTMGLWAG